MPVNDREPIEREEPATGVKKFASIKGFLGSEFKRNNRAETSIHLWWIVSKYLLDKHDTLATLI